MTGRRNKMSTTLRCVAALVAVLFAILIVLLARNSSRQQERTSSSPISGNEGTEAPHAPHQESKPMHAGAQQKPLVLMGPSSADKATLSLDYLSKRDLSDGRQFVSFDIAAAKNMQLGDTFALQIPGEATASIAMVNDIEELDGIRRLTGAIVNVESSESRFSLTLSDDGSYVAGHFVLAGREYIVEARNGAGWLMEANLMTDRLIQSEHANPH